MALAVDVFVYGQGECGSDEPLLRNIPIPPVYQAFLMQKLLGTSEQKRKTSLHIHSHAQLQSLYWDSFRTGDRRGTRHILETLGHHKEESMFHTLSADERRRYFYDEHSIDNLCKAFNLSPLPLSYAQQKALLGSYRQLALRLQELAWSLETEYDLRDIAAIPTHAKLRKDEVEVLGKCAYTLGVMHEIGHTLYHAGQRHEVVEVSL